MGRSESNMPMSAPTPSSIEIAESSLRRCAGTPFLQSFYRHLLGVLPDDARHKFDQTDFERQNKLLQHGLGLLFSFAKRPNPALLERIAVRHGGSDLDIAPTLHPLFADSLIRAVREFDSLCSPEIEQAWRDALAPGIAFIASRHTGTEH